ncbi:hypothetical protein Vretifemale_4295 [Volvox reticuliferus]|uniref:Uncharacterized protein n=1 Tax=Volvox reticuliferus TaxID=1737510 RepID=A0A8J4FJ90_9CHLO|nr:hypothetical protein Vretifemale_4295 [Volvox reticuliferus]
MTHSCLPSLQLRSRVAAAPTTAHARQSTVVPNDAKRTNSSMSHLLKASIHIRNVAFAALASVALVLGPCDYAEAARTGGRLSGHRTAVMSRKRTGRGQTSSLHQSASARNRVPKSVRLHAVHPILSAPDPAAGLGLARPPLLYSNIVGYPDLAAGIDLEALPLWASLLGLFAANIAGLALTIAVLRNLQDSGEPITVVKLQVAMLERRPQLQSKLRELNSMIQVGQQGAWLILEEAILQLLQHQDTIAYASVTQEQLSSKKRAYTVFGEIAEAEAAKASRRTPHGRDN